jgi:NAD(P)-dependent dehydrogenase (short-subunit alcohol dehydrogenase family)
MSRVAIVTGGNKGVGFATCRGLSKKFNGDVYLTARSSERGMAAVAELIKEGCTVHFHQLDIDEPSSIEKMRDFMKKKYGGIDVLINNAAIALETEPMRIQADLTCKTNYWSTKSVCDLLFSTLKPGARVVNVSSSLGKLSTMPDSDLKKKMASSGFGLTVSDFLYFPLMSTKKSTSKNVKL